MEIFTTVPPVCSGKTAVALGFFDGVHIGHRSVISAACAKKNLSPVVYTFAKSPKTCVTGKTVPALMTDWDKRSVIQSLGAQRLYTVDFNSVRSLSPEKFIKSVLKEGLNAQEVFCGFNYRFGVNGSGDVDLLCRECGKLGINVTVIPPVKLDGNVVSSTRIRSELGTGGVLLANKMLGRRFSYSSQIIHGRRLGRTIGSPTINQQIPQELVTPKFGVYVSEVSVGGKVYRGVTNIGVKPTVGSDTAVSETWLIGYSGGELYGENARVSLVGFLREEQKFSSIDELKEAIQNDAKNAAEFKLQ